MADSDDEYDRKRRDKFRGERSSGDSYRSERRDDRRGGGGGGAGGPREDWSDRNPFRGGGGARARPDYRDYRPPRERYGSPGREMPPVKRMRPDWGDDLRGAPRYGAYDPYLMHAWNEHYAAHGMHGGFGGHGPVMPHPREQNIGSDVQTQPAMLTLKQFLDTQDDGISDSEVLRKYSEYKLEFKRQQLNEFFVAHKDEEWFKNKYHPVESVQRKQEQMGFLQKRVDVFNELFASGSIKTVSIDTTQQDPLLRLLDTVVIKLEGGTDDDLKILDEKPRDIIYPDRVIERKVEKDDDVVITSVEKNKRIEEEPKIVSPRPIRRAAAASDDEENWDEDDDDAGGTTASKASPTQEKKADGDYDDDDEDDKFKDDGDEKHKGKKPERKRKHSDSSSSSSSDSDSSSSSSSDEDDVDKITNKYDLAKVKQEKSDTDEGKKGLNDSEETMLVDETSKVEGKSLDDKKEQNGLSLEDKDDHIDSSDDTPNEKKTDDDDDENREDKNKVISEDMENKDDEEQMKGTLEQNDNLKKGANEGIEEKDNGKAADEAKEDSEVNVAAKDDLGTAASPVQETIDLDKEKDIPRPRALHRTSSIFLRNLAPSITKAEIEAICQRFDGYLRVAIADPLVERRWYRRGWVTFKRDVNIKEYCWNLNNTRLRDCEMGAIVNRDLSRRVRPVNGMTSHKTIVRSDIKLCARIALNLDEKFKLWVNEVSESNRNQDSSTSASYGFKSNNPVLQNITDYLIEEASAEEDELLGLTCSANKDTDGEVIERDPQLISVLDCLILYLRIVHSVDFYNHCEYPYEDEMPNRCGIIHARGPTPQKVTQNDIQDYIKNFESKMQTFLAKTTTIEEEDLKSLGCKDAEAEVEKFVQANTQELAKDKWLCPLSGKKFKGPEFIRKHIFNKHMDKVDEVRKEVEFFNNYLRDPKRPQLPEHPGNTKRTNSESSGGYRPPAYPPVYPPYAAYAPPMMMPGRGGRGFGGRRPGGEYRQIIQYRDLDAPQDPVDMFN